MQNSCAIPGGCSQRSFSWTPSGVESLAVAVALLQHNKEFDTPAYTTFRMGCDVWKCTLVERVCLSAAGPAAWGGARWCRLVSTGLVSLAVALLQHNK